MATADDYAAWIVKNADKRGTPEFETVAQAYQLAKQDTAPAPRQPSVADDVGPIQAAMIGAGKSATRIGQGIKQAYYGVTGNDAEAAKLKQQVDDENALYEPLAKARPFATGFGEALPAMAVPIGGAATLPAAMGRAALASAIPAGLEYGSLEERAKRAALQGAGGAAGAFGGYALGKAITPVAKAATPAATEARALAAAKGVPLLPSQATGSTALHSLEGVLSQLPGSSGTMGKAVRGQREAFTDAAMRTMGESGSTVGNDAARIAQQNIGGRIEDAARGVPIAQDMALLDDLAAVEGNHLRNLAPDQRHIVRQYIDDILDQGNTFVGENYQKWRSRIGQRAASTQDSELKTALKGIQKALDSAFDRSAPTANAEAMTAARGQYQNFKTLEPLLNKAETTTGVIPPAQVANRVVAAKNQRPDAKELARLGQVIGKDYPNSGTPARLFWQDLLTNPMALVTPQWLLGATGLPYLGAQAMTSNTVKKYLANTLLSEQEIKALTKSGGLLGLSYQNASKD